MKPIKYVRVFWGFLLFLGLSILQTPAIAASNSFPFSGTTITVVADDNYPPYIFREPGGQLQGIVVDEWAMWEQKTGILVKLVGMDWGKAQKFMADGRADVIDTIFFNEARAKLYDFTKPYARIDVPVFFHKTIGGITDINSLHGFTIGVKGGDAAVDVLEKHGITTLRQYDSYEAIIQAAAQDKIRVFCVDKPPALYFLYKMNLADDYRQSFSLYWGEFHRAVKKGHLDLLETVENGFAAITAEEHDHIYNKWMGSPLGVDRIYLRYSLGLLVGAVAVVLLLLLWTRTLRRRVMEKTERLRHTLEALSSSEEKYRELVENARTIILKLSPTGEITFLNEYGLAFFGYTSAEIIGRPVMGTILSESESTGRDLVAMLREVLREPEKYELNVNENIRRDGSRVWIAWTNHVVRDERGEIVEILSVGSDITDRKLFEQALIESESKFKSFAEQALVGIYLMQDGAFQYVNPRFAEIFGYTVEELLGGMTYGNLVHPDDYAMIQQQIHQRVTGKILHSHYHARGRKNDGSIINLEIFGSTTTFNNRTAAIGTIMDVTPRVQAEMERNKLEAQLRQAQKMEAIGTLAGGVAHDFNNILAAIVGYTELARVRSCDPEAVRRHLERVLQAAERAKNLIQQILTFSRPTEYSKRPVLMSALIKESLKLLRASIPTTIEIKTTIAGQTATVLGDPTQLHQVVMNICTNGAQAMKEKGGLLEVLLDTHPPEDSEVFAGGLLEQGRYLLIKITDTGPGIDRETLDRVFEPFFTTKGPGEGSGMGLAVAYGIVTNHGGTITVSSVPGQGASFQIYLPLLDLEMEDESASNPTELPTGRERILYVDDEEALVEVGIHLLGHLGYQVTGFSSSPRAWQAFRDAPDQFDLLLTDYTMPNMTGLELARAVLELRPELPIILCTGFSQQVSAETALAAGIKIFLMKPLVMREVAEAVRTALDQSCRAAPR